MEEKKGIYMKYEPLENDLQIGVIIASFLLYFTSKHMISKEFNVDQLVFFRTYFFRSKAVIFHINSILCVADNIIYRILSRSLYNIVFINEKSSTQLGNTKPCNVVYRNNTSI